MAQPSLNELKAFVAIAEHGTFRAAANALGVGPSALSHLIRSLEGNLKVRLLNRTTRSVSLTEAGAHLHERLLPALQDVHEALRALDSYRDGPRGTLRLNASEIGARALMRGAVPIFLERYPECSVDLQVEDGATDIVAAGFDAGIRFGFAVEQDMIAVPFGGQVRFMPFASPAYLSRHGVPNHPNELLDHRCIRKRMPNGKPCKWEFAKDGEEIIVEISGPLTLNHAAIQVETAIAGHGVIYVLESAARPYVEEGLLVPLLEDWSFYRPGLTLYYPGFRQVTACLRAFIDILRDVTRRENAGRAYT
jgi:DNA-binding transcriptional LysR family regulator